MLLGLFQNNTLKYALVYTSASKTWTMETFHIFYHLVEWSSYILACDVQKNI